MSKREKFFAYEKQLHHIQKEVCDWYELECLALLATTKPPKAGEFAQAGRVAMFLFGRTGFMLSHTP